MGGKVTQDVLRQTAEVRLRRKNPEGFDVVAKSLPTGRHPVGVAIHEREELSFEFLPFSLLGGLF